MTTSMDISNFALLFLFLRHLGISYIAQTAGLQGVGNPKKGFMVPASVEPLQSIMQF